MRKFTVETNYLKTDKTACLISMGETKVLTVATILPKVPPFLNPIESGWITAEYSMLPRSSKSRIRRERNKIKKRGVEIERLIARSLRNAVDLSKMPGKSIIVDCDVIKADGGTRIASINGGMISLYILLKEMHSEGLIDEMPVKYFIAGLSAGIIGNDIFTDIDYRKDADADTDMNIVMNEKGKLVEIQGTGERDVFSVNALHRMIRMCRDDIMKIIQKQKQAAL